MELDEETRPNIYKTARTIKRRQNTFYNSLRSIYEDSVFVGEIAQLWPELPLLANLRCGLWYSPNFHSTCYFKSTDGHNNNWSFSTSRLNLHVAHLAGERGGCMIVDSTRKGKRFPDSMSKTIPIWTCVWNRAISCYRKNMLGTDISFNGARRAVWHTDFSPSESNLSPQNDHVIVNSEKNDWDCSLHLPLWISETERASIENHLEQWTEMLRTSGADIASVAACLKKPLRPLWISQKTVIWLNEVPDHDSWDFTPVILVSASSPNGIVPHRTTSQFSWNYIPGAGDDEESWARGLSPDMFWKHAHILINSGPDLCNKLVANIVEKDRVIRAYKGDYAPQVTLKGPKSFEITSCLSHDDPSSELLRTNMNMSTVKDCVSIFWLGSTNVGVGTSQSKSFFPPHELLLSLELAWFSAAAGFSNVDCILNCDNESISVNVSNSEAYLHLPMLTSKLDRFSILNNLPSAVNFGELHLRMGRKLVICCRNGEDISICVCLAILTSVFDEEGNFDHGDSFSKTAITKWEMRKRLVYICKFVTNARPSRGNLKQVFSFLSGGSSSRRKAFAQCFA